MSNKCRALAWSSVGRSPSHQIVAMAIAEFANEEGYCWPSHASIMAKAISIKSKSRLRTILKDLEQDGFLSRAIRNRKDGSKSSNNYWVNLPLSMMKDKPKADPVTPNEPVDNLSADLSTPVDNSCLTPINEYCTAQIQALYCPDPNTVLPGSEYCPPLNIGEKESENKGLQHTQDLESSFNQYLLTKETIALPPIPPTDLHQRLLDTGLGEKDVSSFMTYRFRNLKQANPVVLEALVEQLESLVAKGNDAKEVVRQTIMAEWKGFFPVRGTGTPSGWKTPASEKYAMQVGSLGDRMHSPMVNMPLCGREATATPYEALYEADRRGMAHRPLIMLPERPYADR